MANGSIKGFAWSVIGVHLIFLNAGANAQSSGVRPYDQFLEGNRAANAGDAITAARYWAIACNRGVVKSCVNIGTAYEFGRGVEKDTVHSAQLFRYACENGDPVGCYRLALQYSNGDGVPRDDRQAVALATKSCRAGYADACTALTPNPAPQTVNSDSGDESAMSAASFPPAGQGWTAVLEKVVETDSKGWWVNEFDPGSVKNVRVVEGSASTGNMTLTGDYTYNGGAAGWVSVRIKNGQFECVHFWDGGSGCRGLRSPEAVAALKGLIVKGMANAVTDSPDNNSSPNNGGCSGQTYTDERGNRVPVEGFGRC